MNKKLILILSIALIILLILGGCKNRRNEPPNTPPSNPPSTPPSTGEKTLGSGDYTFTINSGRIERTYEVHVPSAYNTKKSMPVILNFHGGGGDIDNAKKTTLMSETADEKGFIVVYPSGTGKTIAGKNFGTWNAGVCCGLAEENNIDDVGFVNDLLDDLENKFNVDTKRIYATGHSNGAQFTYRLGCELSERIAAIAPHSGLDSFKNCSPSRKVPVIHFHGTEDPIATYAGGSCGTKGEEWQCTGAEEYLKEWAVRNGCDLKTETVYQNGDATCKEYQNCDADVELCTIEGAGHTWSGGAYFPDIALWRKTVGPLTHDISANEEMWKFFQVHPLP